MDNLTHSLTGLALARAGLNRYVPHGTILLIAAANVPDIDVVSLLWGRLKSAEIHRGYTHSLLFLPLVALLPVLFTAAVTRKRLPLWPAWLVSAIGVGSHLLLDTSMSYGVRLLLPFSSRWFYLDLVSLTDWVLLAVLGLAWVGPMLGRLVSEEIGERKTGGRGMARFALLFLVAYGGFRALMHGRALDQLRSRIYDEVLEGPAIRMAAFPQALNPLAWNGIVDGEHKYAMYELGAYGEFDPGSGEFFYKRAWDEQIRRAAQNRAFQYTLYFARFPFWSESPAPGAENGSYVTLTDLRFGRPGESFFSLTGLVRGGTVEQIEWGNAGPTPAR